MIAKLCPRCKKTSYSSATQGKWICPYCDKDLTMVKGRPAGTGKQGELKIVKNGFTTINN